MKAYEMINEENGIFIGVLLYYERADAFIIELSETLDEWTAPFHFASYVRKGIYTIPRDACRMWVRARVVPNERQNIGTILRNYKLNVYDELRLLEIADGRCSQDELAIKKIDEVPEFVRERMQRNLTECVVTGRNTVLCFYTDDTVRKVDLNELTDIDGVDKVLDNEALLRSCKVGAGGYYISFNDSIDIPAVALHEAGERIPLHLSDFVVFAKNNLVDTSETCEILECSRQNLAYMVKQERLAPIKEDVKGNLYLKGEVLRVE